MCMRMRVCARGAEGNPGSSLCRQSGSASLVQRPPYLPPLPVHKALGPVSEPGPTSCVRPSIRPSVRADLTSSGLFPHCTGMLYTATISGSLGSSYKKIFMHSSALLGTWPGQCQWYKHLDSICYFFCRLCLGWAAAEWLWGFFPARRERGWSRRLAVPSLAAFTQLDGLF